MLDDLRGDLADFAAVWVWAFYQFRPNQSFNTEASRDSLEPGFTDPIIARLRALNGPPDQPRIDAPRVVLTAPLPCAVLTKPIDVSIDASGGNLRRVDHVELLVDGKLIGHADRPPYTIMFDPQPYPAGPVTLRAQVVDARGQTAWFDSVEQIDTPASACDPSGPPRP
jgi:hypothetical protein